MTTIVSPRHNRTNQPQCQPSNVPAKRRQHDYQPDDVVELAGRPSRPASMREAIPGINCPGEGETWADIHAFRAKWNLSPVTGE